MKFSSYVYDLFFNIQHGLQPTISVEVGAYDAEFSRRMASSSSNLRAFAFEANRYNVEKFCDDAKFFGVEYLHSAVTDYVGTVPFYFQSGRRSDVGNNSILKRLEGESVPVDVSCTTLDHFFFSEGRASESDSFCLWIDVEGATGKVLDGASQVLAQASSVLVEVEHDKVWDGQLLSGDVLDFFESRGFGLLARDFEFYPKQENFLFVRIG